MSENDGNGKRPDSHNSTVRWIRAIVWMIGTLLKVAGVIFILGGLLAIALSNMDGNPLPDMISGTATTFLGILMVYCGYRLTKKPKRKK